MHKPYTTYRAAASFLCLVIAITGCLPFSFSSEPQVDKAGDTLTPTPNPTLQAIAVMLTQTRAAPTITLTPVITPTITPTPTETTPPQGSSERPVAIGKQITVEGAGLVVLTATRLNAVGKAKAAQGSTFLDIEAILENQSDQPLDYTPLYFHMITPDGVAIEPENSAVLPALQSGTLMPEEWVRGHILFIVPAADESLRLSYSPQVAPGHSVVLWIDLSQPAVKADIPTTGPTTSTQTLPGAGQRVEQEGIALTIQHVAASQRIAQTKAGDGMKLVNLSVVIENVSRTKTPYNPEYFTLKDPDGYEYPARIIPLETMLQAGSLGQGQKVSGNVLFEVPAGANRLIVKYQPQVLAEDYPEIRVAVQVPPLK